MSQYKSMPRPHEQIPGEDGTLDEVLSVDEIFELLSNQRRRYVLYYLWNTDGQAKLGAVAEQVAAWELDTRIEEVPADRRKSVYTSLQQFHLTKMDEKNVVTFRKRDGVIKLASAAENLKRCLEPIQNPPSSGSSRGFLSELSLGASFL